MKLISWIDDIINKLFHSQGALDAMVFMAEKQKKEADYWKKRADFWRKEFNSCYDALQNERRGK